ncbi:MAG: histidine phosphatase family protein [Candidatus Protochlamydia sp.]|nr:histidine phosphatase family protein [Candidatus Protochlamydia sp.]
MLLQTILSANLLLASNEVSLDKVTQLEGTTSTMTRIYLVRHGESLFNQPDANGIKYTSGKSHSIPLSEIGKGQATEMGIKLAGKFSRDDQFVIYSSTALRAQDTADRIFNELRQCYAIERGNSNEHLCELGQGSREGKPKDAEYDEATKIWDSLSAKEKFVCPKVITGESFSEVGDRMIEGLQQVLLDASPHKTLLVTTHYAAMNALAIKLSCTIDQLSDQPSTPLPSINLHNCDMILLELPKGSQMSEAKVRVHFKSEV